MITGDIVRPVVTIAGLDSRRQYVVQHVEHAPFGYTIAFLTDADGATVRVVENAHLVLEVVRTATVKPAAALFN